MSTLSGIANKGEKGKSKFQSLDINNLYRASRGESLETHQHKNTSSRRHGMQTLGKVPSTRRAPANLPSLKSEFSGNDPAVNLVPSGGTGWGSKPGETGPPPSVTQTPSTTPSPPSVTSSPPSVATVSTSTVTAPNTTTTALPTTIPSQNHGDKSWSSITSSGTEASTVFLAHQSPYFQQEFPSLSGDANTTSTPGVNKNDTSHLPGPSLRPQSEGSWMQGGSRPQGQMGVGAGSQQGTAHVPGPLPLSHLPQGLDVSGGRSNLAPPGAGVGPGGPIPPSGVPPHHYRLMPQFMMRHNLSSGNFATNYQNGLPRPRYPYPPDTRFMPPTRGPSNMEQEEVTTRPIIKEEDLKVMDEMSRDSGWAAHDEIDYNQTLSFSDEEGAHDEESKLKNLRQSSKKHEKSDMEKKSTDIENDLVGEKINRENSRELSHSENREIQRAWQQPGSRSGDFRHEAAPPMVNFPSQQRAAAVHQGGRQNEEEEVLHERRRLQNEEIAIAVERAKQRKEEEEKRYEESRQAAAKKLQMLEEKMRSKSGHDKEDINSASINAPQGSSTLLPDWEKDKEKNKPPSIIENKDEKPSKDHSENYRNVQMENRGSFGRDRERERDRDRDLRPDREGTGQSFSRQFQSNLPPRFQKQAADRPPPYYRQGSGGSPQPPYDSRWSVGQQPPHFGGVGQGTTSNAKGYRSRSDNDIGERVRDEKENILDHEKHTDNRINIREKESYEKSYESEDKNKEKEVTFNDDEIRDTEMNVDKSLYLFKEDTFNERDGVLNKKSENETVDSSLKMESRDRTERPQRPDSRDSRASRDSRNSKDSIRDDRLCEESNPHDTEVSWADSIYEVDHKEDKHRLEIEGHRELHQSYQRHIPGPITKEKLEASELKFDLSRNLVPLVRNDKKSEMKKIDHQWESSDAWQRVTPSAGIPSTATESWADMTSSSQSYVGHEDKEGQQQMKNEGDESCTNLNKSVNKEQDNSITHKSEIQREKIVNRGGNRGQRQDSRGSRHNWGGGGNYYRGSPSWRGVDRRLGRHPTRRPHLGREGGFSESEASADEVSVSTEPGKEDRRQHFPRSPKQGIKKSERDDRMRESNRKINSDKDSQSFSSDSRKFDRKVYFDNKEPTGAFEPRGEPSRRGRGGAPFRSKGTASNVGRRMDGYGPPTKRKPFTSETTTCALEEKKLDGFSQNSAVLKQDSTDTSRDDKLKLSQQQLSAGIIGNNLRPGAFKSQPLNMPPRLQKSEGEKRDRKQRDSSRQRHKSGLGAKGGSGSGGEVGDDWETTSEASEQDERTREEDKQNGSTKRNFIQAGSSKGNSRRQSQGFRNGGQEKRNGSSRDRDYSSRKPTSSSGHHSVLNVTARTQGRTQDQQDSKSTDQSGDKKQPRTDNKEKRNNLDRIDLCNTANDNGFQEVRSKKNVKEANRQQREEPQRGSRERAKGSKSSSSQSPGPPGVSAASNKGAYDRQRPGRLPPRFAKLRENSRLQKMAQQQTHEVTELNKINQGSVPVFALKDLTSPAPPPPANAWDKPITGTLRTSTPPAAPTTTTETCIIEANDNTHSASSSHRSSPNTDKAVGKLARESAEKAVLDGTSPPVQTIIFENTNYKSAPVDVAMKSKYTSQINKTQRTEKPRDRKIEEGNITLGFKSPGPDMKLQESKSEPIQMPISFNKNEDNADMKLDFRFDSDLAQSTDDKTSKSMAAPIPMACPLQMAAQSLAADLQFKLASVKKVWETPPAGLEHVGVGEESSGRQTGTAATAFTPTFEESNSYNKPADSSSADDSAHSAADAVYNSNQQLQNSAAAYNGSSIQTMIKSDPSSNVCKVKPQPQAPMGHSHSGPLSPSTGVFNTSTATPSQHVSYQSSLLFQPPAQYGGISAIPSPPTVFTPQAELYPTFQINNPQVMGSQGRSQFSQFASPYLSQGLGQTSGFSQQSMYLHQTAPPPTAATAPPPPHAEIFQTQLSQYRIQPGGYGSGVSQQLSNNPNTVLISSSANSLMSASVKPSPQPIGAIGSKAGSYQPPPSQPPPSQLYIYPDPQLLNQSPYIQNSQLVQRPANNVVPTLPPSSASFYSASTGGATGYYQPGSSSMHQTFGLQAFNTQSPAPNPAGMGSFGSSLLSNGLQMAQQYRSTAPTVPYLKSAADHQDMLSLSVFSPATQINSQKPRTSNSGNGKQSSVNCAPQQQPGSTPGHHRFATYQQNGQPTTQLMIQQQQQQQQQQQSSVNLRVASRFPTPIQRPVIFQHLNRPRPPARYKAPATLSTHIPSNITATAAATTATHFYVSQNNSSKHDKPELESKEEEPSRDCAINSSATSTGVTPEIKD